ncbi:response regulator [Spirochaeta isovalerica]|uniref:Two-component system response regulator YesN n=1 Tax=Spirochaeta isovalerica TaxID=150 RepID=A0A841R9W8_9SPIO|nr:response regulator [Spirochaeta isovalerica]MBB6480695.1 two-component system response regulator YesN [Spirochaeta isovalerica]
MFRLIFVDDEAIIRNGISQCVSWGANGFDLAGMFENGREALNYIHDNPVDVVITDINMPKMDGLTLSKVLSEQYPSITVLLLTGYDDFEYARQAVQSQVREFLLKPITAEELSHVLGTVREELEARREKEIRQEEMREKLKRSFPLLKERFFNRLISGRLSGDDLAKRREYFQWNDLGAFYKVSLISVPESWDELERLTLQEQIKALTEEADEVFFNLNENIVIIFQGISDTELQQRTRTVLEKIFQYTGGREKEQIYAGCGELVNSVEWLPESHRGAMGAVEYSRILGLTRIVFIEDVRDSRQITPELFYAKLDILLEALKEGRKEDSLKALDTIFSFIEEQYLSRDDVFSYYTRIHMVIYNFLKEMGLLSPDDDTFPHKPGYYPTLKSARDAFASMINDIESKIERRRNDAILSRMDKARDIIAARYSDSRFSLQDMCNELYLSTSQFSFLFKEGTGQTFVEYLTSYRVEEAKKLLKSTDLKAYEIAEKVGYQDARYFSLIFRKQTGLTAMEYRRKLES